MATNFDNYKITTKGYIPDIVTPLDVRTVVNTFEDIASIPKPFVGMQVYVVDEDTSYLVKKISTKQVGPSTNYYIDTADTLALTKVATSDNITEMVETTVGESAGFGTVTASLTENGGETGVNVETSGEDTAKNFTFSFFNLKGEKGDKGESGETGTSIIWKGEFSTAPSNPQNGWAYYNTTDGKSYVYQDGGWYQMTKDGEKGDTGPQGPQGEKGEGAKVAIKGRFSTLDLMVSEWSEYYTNPGSYASEWTNSFILPLESGDGYIVEESGHLYVFFNLAEDFENAWTDAGVIKGDSSYLYVAYSNNSDGSGFWWPKENPTPGRYIGIKSSTESLDEIEYTDFVWSLWQGEDGWGYEQVFLLTKAETAYTETNGPKVPTDNTKTPDYLPLHGLNSEEVKSTDDKRWADRPLSVSEEWPLCWVTTRKVGITEDQYTDWKGDVNGKAILYSRWSKDGIDGTDGKDGADGVDAIHLELSNDQAIIPFENGSVDSYFTDEVSTQMTLYKGASPVTSGVTYNVDNTTAASCTNGKVTLNLSKLSGVNSITCTATYNHISYSKVFHIVKTSTAYEIIPSTNILVKDAGVITSPSALTVEVKKWNDDGWDSNSGKSLFVEYLNEDTSVETVSINNSTSARAIDLTKTNIASIRLFVTADNDKAGVVLSQETIGVISDGDDGEDGYTYKTAYAFTRSKTTITSTPTGGSFDNPIPNSTDVITWSDSVPNDLGAIYVTTRTFRFDNADYGEWSIPRELGDTSDFKVEFSTSESKPTNVQSLQSFYEEDQSTYEADWRESEAEAGRIWIDGEEGDTTSGVKWMATSRLSKGTWSDWAIVQIKGEKGEPGEKGADGTSVKILGTVSNTSELNGAYDDSLVNGDGYLINGYLWIYQGKNKPAEGESYYDEENGVYWLNVGVIQGPAGLNAYLYVRCSDTETDTNKALKEEGATGKYIGYLVSGEVLTKEQLQNKTNDFTWTRWSGQDGWGWEQVYILTSNNTGPLLSNLDSEATPDFIPTGWSDTPLVPDASQPYCWEARRKVTGSTYGAWQGVKDADGYQRARLFDKYVSNGKDAIHLEVTNEFATAVVDEDNKVTVDISTSLLLYKGDEEITDKVTYSYESQSGFTAEIIGGEITLKTLTDSRVVIVCTATYNEHTYKRNFTVHKSDTAWRLSSSVNVINKTYDGDSLKITTGDVNFAVEKWSGLKWESANKNVFLSYYLNSSECKISTDGSFNFLSINGDAADFKIFITDNDTKEGTILDQEYLGIVIDGKDGIDGNPGAAGSDAYSIELTNDFGIVPLESNGNIDTSAGSVGTQIVMMKGGTVLDSGDGVTYTTNPIADGEKIQLNNTTGVVKVNPSQYDSADTIPTEIKCTAIHGEVTLTKTFHIQINKNAYEMIVPKHMLQRDLSTGLLVSDDQTLNVVIRKWNANTNAWENPANDQALYVVVDCVHFGSVTSHSQYKVVNDGTAEIKLDKENLQSVRLYLNTTSDVESARENYLTYEDLGVYANGEDGSEQECLYYRSATETTPINPTPTNYDSDPNYNVAEWTPSEYLSNIGASYYTSIDGATKLINSNTAVMWTDEPTGIDAENYPYEYVAIRYKKNGTWGAFSTPVLWSAYGKKGEVGPQGPEGPQGPIGTFSEEEKTALLNQAQENIAAAKDELENKITTAEEELDNAKIELQNAIDAEKAAREAAQKEFAEAASNYAIKTEVNDALIELEEKYFDEDGKIIDSALNETDIYNLSKAALGIDAETTPDDLAKDSIFAQYACAVVGNFGTVKAANIQGDTIQGHTIQSNVSIDTNGTSTDGIVDNPTWRINNDGTGWLAQRNINWDDKGNIQLGSVNDPEGNYPTVNIGCAWIVDSEGSVKTPSESAKFNNDGSGRLGAEGKGLSWDEDGNVTINSQLKYNFQTIPIDQFTTETGDTTWLIVSDVNKYLIVDSDISAANIVDSEGFDKKKIYLNWWSSKITEGTLVEVDIINGYNDTIIISGVSNSSYAKTKIQVPIRDSHDYVIPQNNFVLKEVSYLSENNETSVLTNRIHLLPGTNLQLQLYKSGEYTYGYIKNIGAFQLTANISEGNKLIATNVLCSIAPEHNNNPVGNVLFNSNKDSFESNIAYTLRHSFVDTYDANFADAISKMKDAELTFKIGSSIPKINCFTNGDVTNRFPLFASDYKWVTYNDDTDFSQLNNVYDISYESLLTGIQTDLPNYRLDLDWNAFNTVKIPYFMNLVHYVPKYGKVFRSKKINLNSGSLSSSSDNIFSFDYTTNDDLNTTIYQKIKALLVNSSDRCLDVRTFLEFTHIVNIELISSQTTGNLEVSSNKYISKLDPTNAITTYKLRVTANDGEVNANSSSFSVSDNWITVTRVAEESTLTIPVYEVIVSANTTGTSRTGSITFSNKYTDLNDDVQAFTRTIAVTQSA